MSIRRKSWRDNLAAGAREKLEDKQVRSRLLLLFEIAVTLIFAALVAITFFQSVTMQESSMEPTISVGERFFMNRLVYRVMDPKRGDIIVFKTNGSDDAALHIRRIVGIPGDTVQIVDGRVLVNGGTLKEKGDFPSISNPGLAASPVTLQSGEYFVLGDNRNNSEDSRYGDIGTVNKKYIVGKLWFQIGPMTKMGFMGS
ncbi:MAG: signal peptidase I [Blautia sp.]|nr:signal peptidase I [Blautia sp.]